MRLGVLVENKRKRILNTQPHGEVGLFSVTIQISFLARRWFIVTDFPQSLLESKERTTRQAINCFHPHAL
jgi:hypothetical protein